MMIFDLVTSASERVREEIINSSAMKIVYTPFWKT